MDFKFLRGQFYHGGFVLVPAESDGGRAQQATMCLRQAGLCADQKVLYIGFACAWERTRLLSPPDRKHQRCLQGANPKTFPGTFRSLDLKFVFADFTVDLEVDYADSFFTLDPFSFTRRATVDFKFFTQRVWSRWTPYRARGE